MDLIEPKKPTGYRQVSLPQKMVTAISDHIAAYPERGYTAIPEFIREAIREKFDNDDYTPYLKRMRPIIRETIITILREMGVID